MDVDKLVVFLTSSNQTIFIEAEAKPKRMNKFIQDYNLWFRENPIATSTDGIVVLQENANKWGLELRLYLKSVEGMSSEFETKTTKNAHYRDDFSYRINDNDLIHQLFHKGYRIGYN